MLEKRATNKSILQLNKSNLELLNLMSAVIIKSRWEYGASSGRHGGKKDLFVRSPTPSTIYGEGSAPWQDPFHLLLPQSEMKETYMKNKSHY